MANEFSRLSPEQVRQFNNAISEAKDLTNLQVEIINKVIEGETDIGKLRITYLEKYFDTYSSRLDQIARKHSQLNEAFLILEHQLAENYQNTVNNQESLRTNYSNGNNNSSNTNNNTSSTNAGNNNQQRVADIINQEIRDSLSKTSVEQQRENATKLADLLAACLRESFEETNQALEREESQLTTRAMSREDELNKYRTQLYKDFADKQTSIEESLITLHNLRSQSAVDQTDRITGLRLSRQQELLDAQIAAQTTLNDLATATDYFNNNEALKIDIAAYNAEEQKKQAAAELAILKKIEDERIKYIAKEELKAKRKNNGVLDKEESIRIQNAAKERFELDSKYANRIRAAAKQAEMSEAAHNLVKKGATLDERREAFNNLTHSGDGTNFKDNLWKTISSAFMLISNLAKQLEAKIDEIGKHKGVVDTRLQGSSNERAGSSYWDQLVKDMISVGAVTPYFKQEQFASNIEALVNRGIAFDLKQRAFLMTIQEKIATTFNAADGTLLRLIRIQQEDSTAGRLGMESALNAFLNNMYETSEYLSEVAASVRSSLGEMESLMSGTTATEVEFQVQKWMGSLFSVGMSQEAVQSIANTFGQIAAGQIEGITSGGTSNLLIMAANKAGLPIADLLTNGVDAQETNKLLQSVIDYLADLADSSADNMVVQQQLAKVFGVKASDLRAATNLTSRGALNSIYGNSMTYDSMLNRLFSMAGSMASRTSMAEMMSNVWENGQYSMAGSIADNPITYFIYKLATVVDDAAGGIAIPFINVLGSGVDLNTSVADLMRVAAISGGLFNNFGAMISGLSSSFNGASMLNRMGISSGAGLAITPRGDGLGGMVGGGIASTSSSGYIGNASGSDIKNSTIQEAADTKKQQMIEAKEQEEGNQVDVINKNVLKIYELLDDVVNGSSCLKVKVEGYGITRASNNISSAQAGLDGIANQVNSGYSGGASFSSSSSNSYSINNSGSSSSLDLGGWTIDR